MQPSRAASPKHGHAGEPGTGAGIIERSTSGRASTSPLSALDLTPSRSSIECWKNARVWWPTRGSASELSTSSAKPRKVVVGERSCAS
eukprot:7282897-Prymnesium_polylepis.1